jgi:hypothetical protein
MDFDTKPAEITTAVWPSGPSSQHWQFWHISQQLKQAEKKYCFW